MQPPKKSIPQCFFTRVYPRTCSISLVRCRWRPITRLAGVEPPREEDNETTIDQLKARLARTVTYLKTLDRKAIDSSAEREITFPLGPTTGHMNGADYLIHFLLPNFHFHVTAAYAILRHCGVEIAKRDYFGAIPIKTT
jgi:uncharacterized protein